MPSCGALPPERRLPPFADLSAACARPPRAGGTAPASWGRTSCLPAPAGQRENRLTNCTTSSTTSSLPRRICSTTHVSRWSCSSMPDTLRMALGGGQLREHVAAVAVVVEHALHAVQLADGAVETPLQVGLELRAARRLLVVAACRGFCLGCARGAVALCGVRALALCGGRGLGACMLARQSSLLVFSAHRMFLPMPPGDIYAPSIYPHSVLSRANAWTALPSMHGLADRLSPQGNGCVPKSGMRARRCYHRRENALQAGGAAPAARQFAAPVATRRRSRARQRRRPHACRRRAAGAAAFSRGSAARLRPATRKACT